MSEHRRLLFVAMFALTIVNSATAASYYVNQSGAGSKNGLSLGNAWSVATYNASSLPGGGDTVLFSGTITSTITPKTSGTGNGSGRLTLDFTSANLAPPAIVVGGANYITLKGGPVATDSGGHSVIYCNTSAAHDVTVSGFTFIGAAGNSGTDAFIELSHNCNNWTVSNNTADNVVNAVIADGGSVSGLDIANNFMRSSTNTVQQTDVLFLPDCTNCTIEGNKLVNRASGSSSNGRHNDVIQTFRSGSSNAVNPGNWVIRYNWIERAETDGSGGNMSWNEIEGLAGSGTHWAGKWYGNVYVGGSASWDGGNGVDIHADETGQTASDTNYFYNNTLYLHSDPVNPLRLGAGDGPATVYFRNNALSGDTSGCLDSGNCPQVSYTAGAPFDYNFFYNWNGNCSSAFSGAHGSCATNPQFNNTGSNTFSLNSASSLINAGDSTIGSEYAFGICAGATWPNPSLCPRSAGKWDVGAYQSGAAPSQPSPPTNLTATPQ